MLEIINEVLSSEERAEKLLQEARDEAARLRNEFSETENSRIRERRTQADQRLREELAAVREAEERRRHEAEEGLRKVESGFSDNDPAGLSEAVKLSVQVVVRGPHIEGKDEEARDAP